MKLSLKYIKFNRFFQKGHSNWKKVYFHEIPIGCELETPKFREKNLMTLSLDEESIRENRDVTIVSNLCRQGSRIEKLSKHYIFFKRKTKFDAKLFVIEQQIPSNEKKISKLCKNRFFTKEKT